MKHLLAATALAVSLIGGAVTVQADGRDQRHERCDDHRHDRSNEHRDRDRSNDQRGHDRRDFRQDHSRNWDRDHRDWNRRDWNRHDNRNWDGRDWNRHNQRRYHYGAYVAPRGYYHRSWRYGDHLPAAYYGPRYIVHDYHAYSLRSPPRGYRWVRVDNDVFLAAIASGLVVQAVYDLFY